MQGHVFFNHTMQKGKKAVQVWGVCGVKGKIRAQKYYYMHVARGGGGGGGACVWREEVVE